MYKAIDKWLPPLLRSPRWRRDPSKVTDLLLCVCDHFEPLHQTDKRGAVERLDLWLAKFPELAREFSDFDRQRPRHTFFYPIEQYDPDILAKVAELCALTGGETEIHLHHENDTAESLRAGLERGKRDLARHGLLPRDGGGRIRYGFIHGNWALDNSHPQGRHCGVSDELSVLCQTGCYADFTMPSMPSPTQARVVNSLYYAKGAPEPRSFDRGRPAAAGQPSSTSELLLVQGPLGLNWRRRKFGLLPRLENGDLTGANPPRPDRMKLWTRLGIHVQGRPEWLFIKLHTHGAIPRNSAMLLGEPMRRFHRYLQETFHPGAGYRLHYVSARELTNILHAAEDGKSGNAGEFRDYRYRLPQEGPTPS